MHYHPTPNHCNGSKNWPEMATTIVENCTQRGANIHTRIRRKPVGTNSKIALSAISNHSFAYFLPFLPRISRFDRAFRDRKTFCCSERIGHGSTRWFVVNLHSFAQEPSCILIPVCIFMKPESIEIRGGAPRVEIGAGTAATIKIALAKLIDADRGVRVQWPRSSERSRIEDSSVNFN